MCVALKLIIERNQAGTIAYAPTRFRPQEILFGLLPFYSHPRDTLRRLKSKTLTSRSSTLVGRLLLHLLLFLYHHPRNSPPQAKPKPRTYRSLLGALESRLTLRLLLFLYHRVGNNPQSERSKTKLTSKPKTYKSLSSALVSQIRLRYLFLLHHCLPASDLEKSGGVVALA